MTAENEAKPFILTMRLIRSFEHRNYKNFVLKVPSLEITVKELKALINGGKFILDLLGFERRKLIF